MSVEFHFNFADVLCLLMRLWYFDRLIFVKCCTIAAVFDRIDELRWVNISWSIHNNSLIQNEVNINRHNSFKRLNGRLDPDRATRACHALHCELGSAKASIVQC